MRGEACFKDGSDVRLASLNASSNSKPNYQPSVGGITLVEGYISPSGAVVCKYRRLVYVPEESKYFYYNLRTPHFVIQAFGKTLLATKYPSYHFPSNYKISDTAVTFIVSKLLFLNF